MVPSSDGGANGWHARARAPGGDERGPVGARGVVASAVDWRRRCRAHRVTGGEAGGSLACRRRGRSSGCRWDGGRLGNERASSGGCGPCSQRDVREVQQAAKGAPRKATSVRIGVCMCRIIIVVSPPLLCRRGGPRVDTSGIRSATARGNSESVEIAAGSPLGPENRANGEGPLPSRREGAFEKPWCVRSPATGSRWRPSTSTSRTASARRRRPRARRRHGTSARPRRPPPRPRRCPPRSRGTCRPPGPASA